MNTVLIYVDTSKEVGDRDHLKAIERFPQRLPPAEIHHARSDYPMNLLQGLTHGPLAKKARLAAPRLSAGLSSSG